MIYPLAARGMIGSIGKADIANLLPYTFDPSVLEDGALPAPWIGGADTWSIASGVAVNSPTLGSELLTDGGLEANYTAGQCDSLTTLVGSPTLAESSDAHGGSKAQSYIGNANNDELGFPAVASPTAHQWYLFSLWLKRLAGSTGRINPKVSQSSGVPSVVTFGMGGTDSSYAERRIAKRAANTNNFTVSVFHRPAVSTDQVLGDDCSFKRIVHSTLLKIFDSGVTDQIVKLRSNWDGKMGVAGCVAKCNAAKTSFLIAYYWLYSSTPLTYCVLEKCVNGVYTPLIATWSNSGGEGIGGMPTTSQDLEIRTSGTTVQLFHNNIQVGANQTVNDAEIANNTYAGLFDTGGNSTTHFFVQEN